MQFLHVSFLSCQVFGIVGPQIEISRKYLMLLVSSQTFNGHGWEMQGYICCVSFFAMCFLLKSITLYCPCANHLMAWF